MPLSTSRAGMWNTSATGAKVFTLTRRQFVQAMMVLFAGSLFTKCGTEQKDDNAWEFPLEFPAYFVESEHQKRYRVYLPFVRR